MKRDRFIGALLVSGAGGLLIPYTILTIIFDYPNILRNGTDIILIKFQAGGNRLIWTWWSFAILGSPLLGACILLGQKLEQRFFFIRFASTLGFIGLLVQMIGLLRWTFVVPVLANDFATGNQMTKEASIVAFQVIHQFGGVILGEHIGQLFTIAWTIMLNAAFAQLKQFPKWIIWLGYISSAVYLLAQLELFATVINGFPVIKLAGFAGSTLWIVWLLATGITLLRKNINNKKSADTTVPDF